METEAMFERASRIKLRFTYRGLCTVEDLWDIPLKGLDSVFKGLNAQRKDENEESLLTENSQEDKDLVMAIEIVKHVVQVLLAEREAKKNRATKVARKQKLLAKIADKQDSELDDLSVDDLIKLAEELV